MEDGMRVLSLSTLTASALLSASLTAVAADLPVKAAPAPMVPLSTWTGCYIGGNVGGTWGSGDVTVVTGATVATRSGDNSGFAGGGQIGCDFQSGSFVFGFRNLFDWSDRESSGAFATGALTGYTATLKNNWVDLLTGRIGYSVQPNWLLYFQGGAAWRESSLSLYTPAGVLVGETGRTRSGWTIGVGSEYKFSPNWSAFIEYNYADFGTRTGVFTAPIGTVSASAKSNVSLLLVGLNWRTNWGP
jgi:outer membrane immunogenic protein